MSMIYIFWTCRDPAEAKKIVRGLLDHSLIACATLFPEVESIYRWKDNLEEGKETKVILKTRPEYFESVRSYIEANGSYEIPEISQVDISQANSRYVEWVLSETEGN